MMMMMIIALLSSLRIQIFLRKQTHVMHNKDQKWLENYLEFTILRIIDRLYNVTNVEHVGMV